MGSIETLATFFGWCTVINTGILLGLLVRGIVVRKLKLAELVFGVAEEEVKTAYVNVFMQYRSAILIFNLTPYIALKIMA
ncbi:MAG: hypothetical protein VCE43_17060 [Myxococcota bacterium]